jgi:hypothetical protein
MLGHSVVGEGSGTLGAFFVKNVVDTLGDVTEIGSFLFMELRRPR